MATLALTSIIIGRQDILPSGHGRDSPVVAIVGIVCGLAFAVLFGVGLYLLALLRQSGRMSFRNVTFRRI